MIQSILMEYLAQGALPVYDLDPGIDQEHYVLEFNDALDLFVGDANWRPVRLHSHRLIVPLNIDADLIECQGQVPNWIAQANALPGDGTLVFSIRTMAPLPNGVQYVCAGLAYSPIPLGNAFFLNDLDPVELIRHVLQGNREHEMVRGVLDRRGAQAREEARYWQMAEEIRAIERKEAHKSYKRAARLLHGCLTPEQRREWHKKNHIHVNGQDGQLYRIEARHHQNVFLIRDGKPVMQFCVVSLQSMPVPDLMLAQKLMLESSIEHFMKLANRWDLQGRVERERVMRVDIPGIDFQFPDLQAAFFDVGGLDRLQVEPPEQVTFDVEGLDPPVEPFEFNIAV